MVKPTKTRPWTWAGMGVSTTVTVTATHCRRAGAHGPGPGAQGSRPSAPPSPPSSQETRTGACGGHGPRSWRLRASVSWPWAWSCPGRAGALAAGLRSAAPAIGQHRDPGAPGCCGANARDPSFLLHMRPRRQGESDGAQCGAQCREPQPPSLWSRARREGWDEGHSRAAVTSFSAKGGCRVRPGVTGAGRR